jgi:hypothetical protein
VKVSFMCVWPDDRPVPGGAVIRRPLRRRTSFNTARMAVFVFGEFTLILDAR